MEDKKRNIAYDIVKFILAFGVIIIHFSANKDIIAFFRIAVPVFFMLSGYLCEKPGLDKSERLARIKRLHKNQIKSTIFLGAPCVVYQVVTSIYKFKIVNSSCIIQFWFMVALIIITGIYYVLVRFNKEKILFYLILPLLFGNLLLGCYSKILLGADLLLRISRNSIFVGLPFYSIGLFFRRFSLKLSVIQKIAMFMVFIVFGVLQIIERRYVISFGDNIGNLYISTIFSSVALFLFVINTNLKVSASKYNKYIGNNFTFHIYCFHMVIGDIVLHFNISNVFLIFLSTIVFVYLIHIIQLFLKKHTSFKKKKLLKKCGVIYKLAYRKNSLVLADFFIAFL